MTIHQPAEASLIFSTALRYFHRILSSSSSPYKGTCPINLQEKSHGGEIFQTCKSIFRPVEVVGGKNPHFISYKCLPV